MLITENSGFGAFKQRDMMSTIETNMDTDEMSSANRKMIHTADLVLKQRTSKQGKKFSLVLGQDVRILYV
jgi:hypothetical protein